MHCSQLCTLGRLLSPVSLKVNPECGCTEAASHFQLAFTDHDSSSQSLGSSSGCIRFSHRWSYVQDEGGSLVNQGENKGIKATRSCSLLNTFWSCLASIPDIPFPSYCGLLLSLFYFMAWWVSQKPIHNGQMWMHSHSVSHGQAFQL